MENWLHESFADLSLGPKREKIFTYIKEHLYKDPYEKYSNFFSINQRLIDYQLLRLFSIGKNAFFGVPGSVDREDARNMRLFDVENKDLRKILYHRASRDLDLIYGRFLSETKRCPDEIRAIREIIVIAYNNDWDTDISGDYMTIITIAEAKNRDLNTLITADYRYEDECFALKSLYIGEDEVLVDREDHSNIFEIQGIEYLIPNYVTTDEICTYAHDGREGNLFISNY